MKKVTLTFKKDEEYQKIVDSFCLIFGYPEQVPDPDERGKIIDNPQSKDDFLKQCLVKHMSKVVRRYELALKESEIDSEFDIS